MNLAVFLYFKCNAVLNRIFLMDVRNHIPTKLMLLVWMFWWDRYCTPSHFISINAVERGAWAKYRFFCSSQCFMFLISTKYIQHLLTVYGSDYAAVTRVDKQNISSWQFWIKWIMICLVSIVGHCCLHTDPRRAIF